MEGTGCPKILQKKQNPTQFVSSILIVCQPHLQTGNYEHLEGETTSHYPCSVLFDCLHHNNTNPMSSVLIICLPHKRQDLQTPRGQNPSSALRCQPPISSREEILNRCLERPRRSKSESWAITVSHRRVRKGLDHRQLDHEKTLSKNQGYKEKEKEKTCRTGCVHGAWWSHTCCWL